jgi:hypothetical protein
VAARREDLLSIAASPARKAFMLTSCVQPIPFRASPCGDLRRMIPPMGLRRSNPIYDPQPRYEKRHRKSNSPNHFLFRLPATIFEFPSAGKFALLYKSRASPFGHFQILNLGVSCNFRVPLSFMYASNPSRASFCSPLLILRTGK